MNALVITPQNGVEHYRQSTDAAEICRAIVVETAKVIQDRKYVMVEGWQAIAIAHGCAASARDVERVDGGVRAIGEVRRMSDGVVVAEAEGFVGCDEPTWFGGEVEKDEWVGPKGNRRKTGKKIVTVLPKRPDYAIRAMAQTRAISRACRSAFAHVVVMMNAGLSTTPAEEVPDGGFDDRPIETVRSEPMNTTPKPVPLTEEKAIADIDACETEAELMHWDLTNEAAIKAMPKDVYERVGAHFVKAKDTLARARRQPAGGDFGIGEDDIPAEFR